MPEIPRNCLDLVITAAVADFPALLLTSRTISSCMTEKHRIAFACIQLELQIRDRRFDRATQCIERAVCRPETLDALLKTVCKFPQDVREPLFETAMTALVRANAPVRVLQTFLDRFDDPFRLIQLGISQCDVNSVAGMRTLNCLLDRSGRFQLEAVCTKLATGIPMISAQFMILKTPDPYRQAVMDAAMDGAAATGKLDLMQLHGLQGARVRRKTVALALAKGHLNVMTPCLKSIGPQSLQAIAEEAITLLGEDSRASAIIPAWQHFVSVAGNLDTHRLLAALAALEHAWAAQYDVMTAVADVLCKNDVSNLLMSIVQQHRAVSIKPRMGLINIVRWMSRRIPATTREQALYALQMRNERDLMARWLDRVFVAVLKDTFVDDMIRCWTQMASARMS